MHFFQEMKLLLLDAVPLSRDGFHIYIGVLSYLAACLVFRRSLSSPWMLLTPLVLALLFEGVDLMADIETFGYFRWHASLKDILNTILPPLLIWGAARIRR